MQTIVFQAGPSDIQKSDRHKKRASVFDKLLGRDKGESIWIMYSCRAVYYRVR